LALQLAYERGKLTALMSPVKAIDGLEIHARVVASNGRVWKLPTKTFDIAPNKLVRANYDWVAPAEGAYEFLAQLRTDGAPYNVGRDTGSPHGGIDTRFVVGDEPPPALEAWTDAPHALDARGRVLDRTLAVSGDVAIWVESGLNKLFKTDTPRAQGATNPTIELALAQGEREAFQLALHPKTEPGIQQVRFIVPKLRHANGNAHIPADNIAVHRVRYHPVRVPTHFEGPTGEWPDALPAYAPVDAPADQTTPVWFTVHAPRDIPAGTYTGVFEVHALGMEPKELFLSVRVFDFALPQTPRMKTDFRFYPPTIPNGADEAAVLTRYRDNALAHRVTLRELTMIPRERADYASVLDSYKDDLLAQLAAGATTVGAPRSLQDAPDQLRVANAFVNRLNLDNRAFVQLADDPAAPAWPRLLETMQGWKERAPDIPIMVTTQGLRPFIPPMLDRWCVHSQVFDTANGGQILQAISEGREVWWYVHHVPPRPYANFFLDFAAIEHRVLFWQAWALGIKGMHYWGVNAVEAGRDPWTEPLDITPANGDGLLVYPGDAGPVDSIRWEVIRDGLEDYDYLALFSDLRKRVAAAGMPADLKAQVDAAGDLQAVIPNLVTFTRDPNTMLAKRIAIAEAIEAMQAELAQ